MSELLENAVASIELGVQDIGMSDPRRVLSATRNIYAGILLLCKHVLWVASPEGTEGFLIYRDLVPMRDGSNIIMVPKRGSRTIDRTEIKDRFEALGFVIDWSQIDALAQIRNDIEHAFAKEPERMSDILGSALPIIAQLTFEHAKKEPVDTFSSETWAEMLNDSNILKRQQARCIESFKAVNLPNNINPGYAYRLKCSYCDSSLVQQVDPKNTEYNNIKLRCMKCGKRLHKSSVLSSKSSSTTIN